MAVICALYPTVVLTTPPEPKDESRLPSALYRTRVMRQGSGGGPGGGGGGGCGGGGGGGGGSPGVLEPAAMIFPSGWSTTSCALAPKPRRVWTLPSEPKLGSGVPSALKRIS